jgi:hypothetical protein
MNLEPTCRWTKMRHSRVRFKSAAALPLFLFLADYILNISGFEFSRRTGRPRIVVETRQLIREMARANFLWGAPRIHGELLKLGIAVSQATVSRYMPRSPKDRRSQAGGPL